MGNVVKVAAVQACPKFFDLEASIELVAHYVDLAAAEGVKLIVFPETFITTFPYWSKSVAGLTHEDPERKAVVKAYVDLVNSSLTVPSQETERLCKIAKQAGMTLVIGANEREPGGKTIYNSLVYIGAQGQLLGVHRKLVPTVDERLIWGYGDGSGLQVHGTPFGRIGGLICFEHHMPLAKYALFCKGEEIHCSAWPGYTMLSGIMDHACRQYAFEGQCFVVRACAVIGPDDVPAGLPGEGRVTWECSGGSAIIAPNGQYVAGPLWDQAGLVTAEIDLDDITAAKQYIDTVGHYSRPELLSLTFDQRRHRPLNFRNSAGTD